MKRGQTDKSALFLTELLCLPAAIHAEGEKVYMSLLPNQESMHVSPVVIFLNYASG